MIERETDIVRLIGVSQEAEGQPVTIRVERGACQSNSASNPRFLEANTRSITVRL